MPLPGQSHLDLLQCTSMLRYELYMRAEHCLSLGSPRMRGIICCSLMQATSSKCMVLAMHFPALQPGTLETISANRLCTKALFRARNLTRPGNKALMLR